MNAKEEYEIRLQMAEMHEEFIERMSEAYDNHYYVEAAWYCYAILSRGFLALFQSTLISVYSIRKEPMINRSRYQLG